MFFFFLKNFQVDNVPGSRSRPPSTIVWREGHRCGETSGVLSSAKHPSWSSPNSTETPQSFLTVLSPVRNRNFGQMTTLRRAYSSRTIYFDFGRGRWCRRYRAGGRSSSTVTTTDTTNYARRNFEKFDRPKRAAKNPQPTVAWTK